MGHVEPEQSCRNPLEQGSRRLLRSWHWPAVLTGKAASDCATECLYQPSFQLTWRAGVEHFVHVLLHPVHPTEERIRLAASRIVPAISKVLTRIDGVRNDPLVVDTLDDSCVLEPLHPVQKVRECGEDIRLLLVCDGCQRCDDHRNGLVSLVLVAGEAGVPVSLENLNRSLERCSHELIRNVIDAGEYARVLPLNLQLPQLRDPTEGNALSLGKPVGVAGRIACAPRIPAILPVGDRNSFQTMLRCLLSNGGRNAGENVQVESDTIILCIQQRPASSSLFIQHTVVRAVRLETIPH
jgi:hypothetical protein